MRFSTLIFIGLLGALAAALLLGSSHTYAAQDREHVSDSGSRSYLAGTDELGRDRAVRTAAALLLGLTGACVASALASSLSLLLGSVAALSASWLGRLLLYCGDLFLTLPWIFLLMLVRSALPLTLPPVQSGVVTFLLLAALGAPSFLRLTHERVSRLDKQDWRLHAHAMGLKKSQSGSQLLSHLWPIFWIQFLLYVPACIIAEANLGTLGLGIAEPVPSWGNMVTGLQAAALTSTSHLVYLPVVTLVLVLVALELTIFGAKQ